MSEDRIVSIKAKELAKLLTANDWLMSLNCAGVDNWVGYDEAERYDEWSEQDVLDAYHGN